MNRRDFLKTTSLTLSGASLLVASEQLFAQGRRGGNNRQSSRSDGQGGRGNNRSNGQGGPTGGFLTDVPQHPFDVILGRPTQNSVTVSLLAYENMQAYLEYGIATTDNRKKTDIQSLQKDEPTVLVIDSLKPDTGYSYRFCWRNNDSNTFQQSKPYAFHTQRPQGQSFVFTVLADSHLDVNTDAKRYEQTLANAHANRPDFHIDLGDTFMTDKYGRDFQDAHAQYLAQRYYYGQLCHSAPLFLTLGNHDGEKGTGRDGSMLMWSLKTRKRYFPNPYPDDFYSGNTIELEGTGHRENYYAWQWGDALFMVLDPFMSSQSRGSGDSWNFSLGKAQYQWLARTLKSSSAKYKFIFIHNLTGGLDRNGRGGSEAAGLYEWGGHNPDGSDVFKARRPGWSTPIHTLLVQNKVSAVFHGHDHFYAKQEKDGIVYQLVPQPGHTKLQEGTPRSASEYGYRDGLFLANSGHMRVSVTPTQATVDYIRSVLPGETTRGPQNGEVLHSYTLPPGS